jgi:hypothetical protein
MNYQFNPEDFGFEHISKFPELSHLFGSTTYIKVIAIGGNEFDRVVYWYKFCYNIGASGDDRWKIGSHIYDSSSPGDYQSMNTVYSGLISSDQFAFELLCHLCGTTQNKSVLESGKERVMQNINKQRLKKD